MQFLGTRILNLSIYSWSVSLMQIGTYNKCLETISDVSLTDIDIVLYTHLVKNPVFNGFCVCVCVFVLDYDFIRANVT